jgi:hypothetical protein
MLGVMIMSDEIDSFLVGTDIPELERSEISLRQQMQVICKNEMLE